MNVERLRYKVYLSLLASLAIVIHALETAIPTPFPWLKFGLSNIVTLTAIVIFGLRAGLFVTALRILVGSVIMGSFLTPAFFLSASGGLASALVLALAYKCRGRVFSIIGVSVIGAYAHTITQIVVAYLLLIRHYQVFLLLPLFLTFSLFSGIISGLGAFFLIRLLEDAPGIRGMAEVKNG